MKMMNVNTLAWLDELTKPAPEHQQSQRLKRAPNARWLQRKNAEQRAISDIGFMRIKVNK